MNILMTGATGLIGKEVGKALVQKGHQLFVVSRNHKKSQEVLPFPCEVLEGDLSKNKINDSRLKKIEAVIHLMGEPVVGGRWTEDVKKKIYESRVLGTRHLIESLKENSSPLKVFISGSAIGFYGDCGDKICNEQTQPGQDFLASVTVDWEKEVSYFSARTVMLRTGIVISGQGGALEKMLFPFKAGLGGVLVDGSQWMSWIHIDDLVGMIVFALENDQVHGPINGVAPNPVSNKDFSLALAQAVGKKLSLPVPKLALTSLYGEAAQTILSSTRCVPEKALACGFKFKYENVQTALDEICRPFKEGEEIFYAEQFVPLPPEKLFPFFKDPYNLETLTPPLLNFKVESVSTKEIEQGTLIDYRLKIHSVPAKWKTMIDEWNPPFKFVDTALRSPYRLWHHTHEFKPFCGGTLLIDRVRYRLPMGYVGWLMGGNFVRKDVETIFSFRRRVICEKYFS